MVVGRGCWEETHMSYVDASLSVSHLPFSTPSHS